MRRITGLLTAIVFIGLLSDCKNNDKKTTNQWGIN